MTPNELIHRYLLGTVTSDEVRELEQQLQNDPSLQDDFLMQAEVDTHLRQEAQSLVDADQPETFKADRSVRPLRVWKWVSGISTLAASILLAAILFYFPPPSQAMAVPSLGKLTANFPGNDQDIWAAAGTGNISMLREELKRRVAVDARTDEALTPLHVAALFGQDSAVQFLLSRDSNVTLTDDEGNTALHMAVFLGHTDVVRTLLRYGADPLARNSLGFNSIEIAAAPWSQAYRDYLKNAEKELNTKLDMNRIRGQRMAILKLLVGGDRGSQPTTIPVDIFYAAITGNAPYIREQISRDADLNQMEKVGGSTPLILATIFGNREVASLLVEAGADLEVRNKSGGTALHHACFFGRVEIAELLLDAGADLTKVNSYGVTPVELVAEEMDSEWKAVYAYTYQSLNLELDLQQIADAHDRIRNMFKAPSSKSGKD